jgi:hypothetical protein
VANNGMIGVLRKIHPRHVIWVLFVTLIATLLFVGRGYSQRLEAVEAWKQEQNGHLQELDTDQKAILQTLQEIRAEQTEQRLTNQEMLIRQEKLATDVKWIKHFIDNE